MSEERAMSDGLERRFLPLDSTELRVEGDEEGRTLSGYAAVFESESRNLGGFTEVIERGAFQGVMSDPERDVFGLFNHNENEVLGRESAGTLRLSTDSRGLRFTVDLDDDPKSQYVARKVERGEVTGASFAFSVSEDGDEVERKEDGTLLRRVQKVARLRDVGPVTFPAYQATEVSARSVQKALEERERQGPPVDVALERDRLRLYETP